MDRRDNVTPFRPRRPNQPQRPGFDLQRPQHKVFLVHALTLATFAVYGFFTTPITYLGLGLGVAAVAIAASNRAQGMPWAATHHEFALRTVLIAGAVWMLSGLLLILPGAGAVVFGVQWVTLAWVAVRVAAGFIRALLRRPTPNPRTPLI